MLLLAKLLEFLKERQVCLRNLGFECLGSTELKERFEIDDIRRVEQKPQQLNYVTRIVAEQVPSDVTHFFGRRIPAGTRIEQQFKALDLLRVALTVPAACVGIPVGPAANQAFENGTGTSWRVIDPVFRNDI